MKHTEAGLHKKKTDLVMHVLPTWDIFVSLKHLVYGRFWTIPTRIPGFVDTFSSHVPIFIYSPLISFCLSIAARRSLPVLSWSRLTWSHSRECGLEKTQTNDEISYIYIYTILPKVLGHPLLMKGLTTLVISYFSKVIGVWWWIFGSRSAFKVTSEAFSWD